MLIREIRKNVLSLVQAIGGITTASCSALTSLMVSVAVPVWKERYKMDERNGHHISRFIYPECANELLRQFRFKSKEEVRETVEYVINKEAGKKDAPKHRNRSITAYTY
jgi:hypothetical protein